MYMYIVKIAILETNLENIYHCAQLIERPPGVQEVAGWRPGRTKDFKNDCYNLSTSVNAS